MELNPQSAKAQFASGSVPLSCKPTFRNLVFKNGVLRRVDKITYDVANHFDDCLLS